MGEKEMQEGMRAYTKEKEEIKEALRNIGCPDKMMKEKSLEQLRQILDRLG